MPEFLADPSVLTKEKLKSELIANNVSLPGGEQRKDVYVQLYLQHLTARNPPALAQPDFSSDEEREPTPLGVRSRGAAAAGRVSTAAPARAASASRQPRARFPARTGPAASARPPRLGARRDAPGSLHGAGRVSGSTEGGIVPGRDAPSAWGREGRRGGRPAPGTSCDGGSVPGAAGCSFRMRPALNALWSDWLRGRGSSSARGGCDSLQTVNWETFAVAWRAVS